MNETFDAKQLTGLSESQFQQLALNGQVMTCLRELTGLNNEY